MQFSRSLAIETSGRFGSVALVENELVVVEETFSHGLKHAAGLLPLINALMRGRGWAVSDLQQLYVSHGPGSFTGLRIGVTLAKTLALVTGAKIVAVPSLRVLVMNAPADATYAIIVLDAKRDQVFTARYERVATTWIEREATHLDSLSELLQRSPRPVHLIGEGIPYHQKFLPADRLGIVITPEECWRGRASVVAAVGIEMAKRGLFADPDRFVPAYVRQPEAEEKYELQFGMAKVDSRPGL
jgi:tRNA threonylcarbamoyladenosine biosynthesis protein TsaB